MSDFAPRLDILPPAQRALWALLDCVPDNFVLYGGTALALRLGHRQSIDFDFFSNDPFTPDQLLTKLPFAADAQRLQSEPNTLSMVLGEDQPVKLSFFGKLRLHRVGQPERATDNGLLIASLLDIAATKMASVQNRSEAKDYQDIHALLRAGLTLERMLAAALGVYGPNFNPAITLKALVYFEDGDLPGLSEPICRQLTHAATDIGPIPSLPAAHERLE
ncbi:MAG: nucleotidyl transferase AbiEii/AbiGii toxin family protein [Phycisphaeraceae bacterium]|nr:nucleotidyl transferase AbiEii/AbiGii toxin family protein [Phycisphaeraceae bacterium]